MFFEFSMYGYGDLWIVNLHVCVSTSMDFVVMDSMSAQQHFLVVLISLSLELVIVHIPRCL